MTSIVTLGWPAAVAWILFVRIIRDRVKSAADPNPEDWRGEERTKRLTEEEINALLER